MSKSGVKISAFKELPALTFSHNLSFDNTEKHSLHLNSGHIELYIFVSGDVDFIVNDNYHTLSKGDILIINPNQVHVAVVKNPTEYERFYILLPLHSMDCFINNPLLDFLNAKNNSAKISLPEHQKEYVLKILYNISKILSNNSAENLNFKILSLIFEFLCIVKEGIKISHTSTLKEGVYIPTIIKDVLNFIGNNTVNITSINDIAKHFNISLPYLSALFKKYVGVTLSNYLRNKRLSIAKTLLEEGHSVSYACYESGFSDSSYFIKVFKNQFGTTPHKYKNKTNL